MPLPLPRGNGGHAQKCAALELTLRAVTARLAARDSNRCPASIKNSLPLLGQPAGTAMSAPDVTERALAGLLARVDESLSAQREAAAAETREANELLVRRCADSEAKRVTLEAAMAGANARADEAERASKHTMRELIAARARADAAQRRVAQLETLLAKANDAIAQVERGAMHTVGDSSSRAILEIRDVPSDLGSERVRALLAHFGKVVALEMRPDSTPSADGSPRDSHVVLVEYVDAPTAAAAADRLHGMAFGDRALNVVQRPRQLGT